MKPWRSMLRPTRRLADERWLVPLCAASALAGCAAPPSSDVLSYDEFAAHARIIPGTELRIMNGDEVVASDEALRAMYARYLDSAHAAELAEAGLAEAPGALIVDRVNNQDNKWSATSALNITYCVDYNSMGTFGAQDTNTRYNATIAAIANAAADWQAAAAVNFVYLPQLDFNGCNATAPVVFDVHRVDSGGVFLAASFFPGDARALRNLQIDIRAYGNVAPVTMTGIIRHELGHTLGFRHEHTRPEAGVCFENNSWRALTAYDSASVMHYPQCHGTNTGDLVLTALDRTGAALLYPRGTFPRLDNNANDPDARFALNQPLAFTGTSETTGNQGPWGPVAGSAHSLDRGAGGLTTLSFNAQWDYSSGPSSMKLDLRFLVDNVVVATQRLPSRGLIAVAAAVAIGAGLHDVRVEARSVLSGGPPISVTLTGSPAVVNAIW